MSALPSLHASDTPRKTFEWTLFHFRAVFQPLAQAGAFFFESEAKQSDFVFDYHALTQFQFVYRLILCLC